jgi:transposase InsO family protein
MSDQRDLDGWARFRFAIIGTLLAAPPAKGELRRSLEALAERSWPHPVKGTATRFSFTTIERWFYAARNAQDPIAALRREVRGDAGRFRTLSAALIQAIEGQYRRYPGWTVQLHYDNLVVLAKEQRELQPLPSYNTLRRYMKARDLRRKHRPKRNTPGGEQAQQRLANAEVRSYEADYVHGLWHADFHHGSRRIITASGDWVTPRLLCFIDDHSRLICHLQWYLEETAEVLIHGLSQALQKRALPRALMTDNGAAMKAEEFTSGLHALGIVHETTLPYSPYQNAKQECFWATLEGRLMAMLAGVEDLTLERLNEITQAWVEQAHHRTYHSEIANTPLQRYLDAPDVGRDCPDSQTLRSAFRCTARRKQRRSDGTVTLQGIRFEIPDRYRHLEQPMLRFARWDLRAVELIDPRTLKPLCPLMPLDKSANAEGQRRARTTRASLEEIPSGNALPPLLRQCLADYAATGCPPAYLPINQETDK